MKCLLLLLLAILGVFTGEKQVFGHVPYFERTDFTKDKPFRVQAIEQSIAVYACLKQEKGHTDDVDVYTFTITKPTRVFVQCLVPVRKRYDKPGERRPTFYEFFGGKSYYRGPTFDRVLEKPGTYHVYYWDPHAHGGDYVAVLGYKETWGLLDVLRALFRTPMIRWNMELHGEE